MNSQMFSRLASGNGLAGVSVEEAQVSGMGGAAYPHILLPVKIDYYSLQDGLVDYVITGLDAQLGHERFGKLADSIPLKLRHVQRGHQHYVGPENLRLEFPVDTRRIAEMERLRDGKDLPLLVNIELTAEEHRLIAGDEKIKRPAIWGVRCILQLTAQLSVTIPRATWIDHVLPNVGFGVVHVVEFPAAPVEHYAQLEHAFKALQQAQEHHKIGLYDDAAGKCRVALEKFFERQEKTGDDGKTRDVPTLKKDWEVKLGKAAYDWLAATLRSIKGAANPTAHSPNEHFDQFESQMLLAITTAVVAYVARTIGPEAEK